jgi:hypothetical protein
MMIRCVGGIEFSGYATAKHKPVQAPARLEAALIVRVLPAGCMIHSTFLYSPVDTRLPGENIPTVCDIGSSIPAPRCCERW